jgi:ubiquinone/menaquinone biosynthesis C-methylase UbiE
MARPEPPTPEVDRLVRTYEGYDADPAHQERWSLDNAGNRAIHAERTAHVAALLGGTDSHVTAGPLLEVGCGDGQVLTELSVGADPCTGVDLSARRLAAASTRVPDATFVRAEGSALPFAASSIATVVAFTLFSSILDDGLSHGVAREVGRVLRPGGVVVWYDLRRRNPANPLVRPLGRADVQALFPGWSTDLAPVTVLPPLARRLGPTTDRLYPLLARLRPLTTHLVGVLAKPA